MQAVHDDSAVFVARRELAHVPARHRLSITFEVVGGFLRSLIHDQLHDLINIVKWESFT